MKRRIAKKSNLLNLILTKRTFLLLSDFSPFRTVRPFYRDCIHVLVSRNQNYKQRTNFKGNKRSNTWNLINAVPFLIHKFIRAKLFTRARVNWEHSKGERTHEKYKWNRKKKKQAKNTALKLQTMLLASPLRSFSSSKKSLLSNACSSRVEILPCLLY